MTFAEEHLREDMQTLVHGEAKQCTSQSELISLSFLTQFQYWIPSSDSPEHISNGVSLQFLCDDIFIVIGWEIFDYDFNWSVFGCLVLTSLTLPQAYIPESDVKLHLTSVLPQRFLVRHSVRRIYFPSCGTYLNRKPRSLEPHKPLDPNMSKNARSNTLRSSATDPLAWFEYNVVHYKIGYIVLRQLEFSEI
ncbi:hypothetical protein AVEN_230758-1 [Araneus ventricosus]|uniref:Uncharacterized protein n=1 Tax=Araneus ventricosus TaxID=182803 RepID=A0A4Y2A232_ARAVE|nr:hypothetical protein AVEN_230758-1 [Araneus ventricosus]